MQTSEPRPSTPSIEISLDYLKQRRAHHLMWLLRGLMFSMIPTFFLLRPGYEEWRAMALGLFVMSILMIGSALGQWFFLGHLLMRHRSNSITLLKRPPTLSEANELGGDSHDLMGSPEVYRALQSFSSIEEAKSVGWQFEVPLGRYQDQVFFKFAQCSTLRFEYVGLRLRMTENLKENERVFGVFMYRQCVETSEPSMLNPSRGS